jgi:hypothetical protein
MTRKTKFHKVCFPQLLGTEADADHKFPQSLCTKADADQKFPQSQADHMWRQQISTIAAQGRKRKRRRQRRRQRRRRRDGVHNLKLKFVGVFFSNMSFAAAK